MKNFTVALGFLYTLVVFLFVQTYVCAHPQYIRQNAQPRCSDYAVRIYYIFFILVNARAENTINK